MRTNSAADSSPTMLGRDDLLSLGVLVPIQFQPGRRRRRLWPSCAGLATACAYCARALMYKARTTRAISTGTARPVIDRSLNGKTKRRPRLRYWLTPLLQWPQCKKPRCVTRRSCSSLTRSGEPATGLASNCLTPGYIPGSGQPTCGRRCNAPPPLCCHPLAQGG